MDLFNCRTDVEEYNDLLAEVVRLLAENAELRRERADVIAYLRALTSDWSATQLSDAIERGEHVGAAKRAKP